MLNDRPLTWNFSVIGDLEVAQVEPLADTAEVLTDTHRISVRFNHPVVALTTIDAQATLPQPLVITPALAGEGRWLDTSTYVFTPKDGLAPSTSYSVRVAAGLQDQTGGALRQEYVWRFSTITPNVIASLPSDGARYAGPSGPIQLVFNQPMDLTSLRSAVTLRRDGANVPGTLTARCKLDAGARPGAGRGRYLDIRRAGQRLCGDVYARCAAGARRRLHAGGGPGRARSHRQRHAGSRLQHDFPGRAAAEFWTAPSRRMARRRPRPTAA